MTLEEVIHLRKSCLDEVRKNGSAEQFYKFVQAIRAKRIEALGLTAFFKKHTDISPPKVLVSASAHYSWEKGMKLTRFGTANLTKIAVDDHMRMDMEHLIEVLDSCLRGRIPVLELVGALGTTEFGTVDPIQNILEQRDRYLSKGLFFPVHIDAAWGGYLTSIFREPDGSLVSRSQLKKEFRYFPSDLVYGAFSSLDRVDSITVDPHKLGYIPYPAGAYISRHRGVTEFITQDAP